MDNKRLVWIDSIRGFAAIMVMILHFWENIYNSFFLYSKSLFPRILTYFTYGVTDFGKIGVVLFFAISGFVIPYSLQKKSIKEFTISRIYRLYPIYWVTILLTTIILRFKVDVTQFIMNLTMFQKFFGVEDMVGTFWTLQIELVFYGLCIILYKLKVLNKDKVLFWNTYLFLGCSFLLAVARNLLNIKLPVALTLALSIMFFGFLWRRYLLKESYLKISSLITYVIIFSLSLLPITLLAYNKNYGFNETWYRYFNSYIIALFSFIVFTKFRIQNMITSFLGKISYSLYLLHGSVGMYFLAYLIKNCQLNSYIIMLSAIVFTLLISTIGYYIVEKPFINISKRINNALQVPRKSDVVFKEG